MPIFPSITGPAPTAGVLYCNAAPIPAAEGDLFDNVSPGPDPIPLPYHRAINAVVELTFQGSITFTAPCYVVMQGDNGDGVWFDLAWCVLQNPPAANAAQNFMLTSTAWGNNAIQQTRAAGTAPTPNLSSNSVTLPGRIRFVGKASLGAFSSASSSSPGQQPPPAVLATIRYTLQGNR